MMTTVSYSVMVTVSSGIDRNLLEGMRMGSRDKSPPVGSRAQLRLGLELNPQKPDTNMNVGSMETRTKIRNIPILKSMQ